MDALLREISAHHLPNPPASPAQIEAFEKRIGWRLDDDLRAFYLHCDGAALFMSPNSPYMFRPLADIVRARAVMGLADTDEWGPPDWYIVCDLQDSNYALVDVSAQREGRYPIRDGYREMFPEPEYCPVITPSFAMFLAGALTSADGRSFWLKGKGT
ncbi:SMI1/KNR4 family protein [Corallococcus sp. M34]|uniref:SMI1/KNR4 family protein n=1 Tax=Citreicoccus inhibens TaxID=2849499 RepID=UPI0018F6A2BF|nr:SMI1/KNR4 family protein [Citreicoccus inhibens]MBU8895281.1 SMI1/KNR4 family protein [Citreicoccus inhibens]